MVSNIFYFHPYLGKWSNLTNIFQMGWNHQLVMFGSKVVIPKKKCRDFWSYCWWLKSCTTWDVWNPISNGKNYLSTGAGFQPSTVPLGRFSIESSIFFLVKPCDIAGAIWSFPTKWGAQEPQNPQNHRVAADFIMTDESDFSGSGVLGPQDGQAIQGQQSTK